MTALLPRHRRRSNSGQSLVEYALVIVTVALIVIAAAFAIGRGAERVFGIVVGALGGHHDDHRQHFISITTAECDASTSQGKTGLWVVGTTDEDLSTLTGSTNLAVATGIDGVPFVITGTAPNYSFNPLLAYSVNLGVCPKSVVIQAADGIEAVSPVTAQNIP